MTRRFLDGIALTLVLAATAIYAWRYIAFGLPPAEDAAMLLRYAGNLAAGHGFVWNVGEPLVDGATDFLFVIAVELLHRFGPSLEHAVLALTVGAHFATVALVYAGLRLQGAGAFASALNPDLSGSSPEGRLAFARDFAAWEGAAGRTRPRP